MKNEAQEKSPWHVPVKVDDISEAGRHFDLVADLSTREAIAAFADTQSIEQLEASFDVVRRGRGGLRVIGEVRAVVRQTCVVSLEPIENRIVEPVDVDFVPPPAEGATADMVNETGDADPPELLVDGGADLGALAVEFLVLGIDPYPRKPGVDFVAPKSERGEGSPFAALAKLKRDPGSKN